jgi:ribonuclease HII
MARRRAVDALSLPLIDVDSDPADDLRALLGGEVAGLDEVGRGPLAGPVVAACVVLPDQLPDVLLSLNDSKQMSEEAREAIYPHIKAHARVWAVSAVEAEGIDQMNILRASLHAMAQAFAACERKLKRAGGEEVRGAVIDGNQKAPLPMRVVQRTVIGGDAKCRAIMAASILAKVTRDRRMVREAKSFPAYAFEVHKGYPTPQHLAALKQHGPCTLHRRSFAPVRALLGD